MGDVATVCSLLDSAVGVVKNSSVPETNSVGETAVPVGNVAGVSVIPACCSVCTMGLLDLSSGSPVPPVTGVASNFLSVCLYKSDALYSSKLLPSKGCPGSFTATYLPISPGCLYITYPSF